MIKVYHYPRCGKSRQGVEFLTDQNVKFQTIEYFKEPFTVTSLADVLKKLEVKPIELVRTNEAVWKEKYSGKELSDNAIIQAMVDHPRLIQRPIVVKNNKAVIGRPTEKIAEIF